LLYLIFFVQAEDGIRCFHVTGVQTCALPISMVKTDAIFSSYKLQTPYRYSDHSLLSTLMDMLPTVPKTLLREHYRCHPKIIEFCNQKFYDNQLIVHSKHATDRQQLMVYKTVAGEHLRQ